MYYALPFPLTAFWLRRAAFGLALAFVTTGLAACGSVDANDDPDPDPAVPAIVLSESVLDFGEVTAGESRTLAITIENDGDAKLEGTLDLSDTAHYSVVGGEGDYAVSAGEALEVEVRYEPQETGEHAAELDISHNASGGMQEVSLSGRGVIPPPPDRPE